MSETENNIITINKNELVKFDTTTEIIEQKEKEYSHLTCKGPGGYNSVKEAWRDMRDMRLNIETYRVKKKEVIKQAANALDGEAKRLTKLTKVIEEGLHIKWKEVDDKAAKIKAEREAKEAKRIQDIRDLMKSLHFNPDPLITYDLTELHRLHGEYSVKVCTLERYQEYHDEAADVQSASMELLESMIEMRKEYDEEQKQLADQKAEQAAEAERLAEERADFEKAQREQYEADERDRLIESRINAIDKIPHGDYRSLDEMNDRLQGLIDSTLSEEGYGDRYEEAVHHYESAKTLLQDRYDRELTAQNEQEKLEVQKQKLADDQKAADDRELMERVRKETHQKAEAEAKEFMERKKLEEAEAAKDIERLAEEKKLADERREDLRIQNLSDSEFILEHREKVIALGCPDVGNENALEVISTVHKVYVKTLLDVAEELAESVVVIDQ